jgi:hypothetical protein
VTAALAAAIAEALTTWVALLVDFGAERAPTVIGAPFGAQRQWRAPKGRPPRRI